MTLRYLSIALIGLGVLLFVTNWLVSRELSVVSNYTSDYVHTPAGALTTLGFIVTGVGMLAAVRFYRPVGVFEVGLFAYSVLFALLAFFPTDAHDAHTSIGTIHTVLASATIPLFPIMTGVALALKPEALSVELVVLPLVSLVCLVLMGLGVVAAPGIFQRVAIFSQTALVIVLVCKGRLIGAGS